MAASGLASIVGLRALVLTATYQQVLGSAAVLSVVLGWCLLVGWLFCVGDLIEHPIVGNTNSLCVSHIMVGMNQTKLSVYTRTVVGCVDPYNC